MSFGIRECLYHTFRRLILPPAGNISCPQLNHREVEFARQALCDFCLSIAGLAEQQNAIARGVTISTLVQNIFGGQAQASLEFLHAHERGQVFARLRDRKVRQLAATLLLHGITCEFTFATLGGFRKADGEPRVDR